MNISSDLDITKDVFRGSVARSAGAVTKNQLRGPTFRRLFQDVYVHRDVPVTHELRCRGAALIAPRQAVLTGRSAATVRGLPLARTYDPVEFVVPEEHRFGPVAGMHIRRTNIRPSESRTWRNVRIARSKRIALDVLLRHSPRSRGWVRRLRIAVPDLDALHRAGLIRISDLTQIVNSRRNRGIVFARHAVALADSRSESFPESEVRVILNHAGVYPQLQRSVRINGKFLGRLDMCIEDDRLAIEYDGAWHEDPRQRAHDQRRRSRLIAAGWRFVVLTADDLTGPWEDIVTKVTTRPPRRLHLAG